MFNDRFLVNYLNTIKGLNYYDLYGLYLRGLTVCLPAPN